MVILVIEIETETTLYCKFQLYKWKELFFKMRNEVIKNKTWLALKCFASLTCWLKTNIEVE